MSQADPSPLTAQQTELVRALTGQAPPPAGFAAERLQAAAQALARKRARAAARAWPALAAVLGDAFTARFAEYAARTPLPSEGGPLADSRAFAAFLAGHNALPPAGRREAFLVDLRHVRTALGLRPRRRFTLRMLCDRPSRRFLIGLRLPWLGVHVLALPWPAAPVRGQPFNGCVSEGNPR